jgi:hypothetical protein
MDLIVLFTAIHSWVTNIKAMKAFSNLDKIYKIFEGELGHALKYDDFIRRFKVLTVAYQLIFVISTLATLGFIFYHTQASTTFYWGILVIFPYMAMGIAFLKYVFYIELITINSCGISEVLRKAYNLKQMHRVDAYTFNHVAVKPRPAPENETIFDTIMVLKRLYGILYETSQFVNGICGSSMIFQLIMIIICNSSAGYKVYLVAAKILPVGRIGIPAYTIAFTYGLLSLIIHYACKTYESVKKSLKMSHDKFHQNLSHCRSTPSCHFSTNSSSISLSGNRTASTR